VALVGGTAEASAKSDKTGKATVKLNGAGRYALRVRHTEDRKGNLDGKKYEEVRSYATLTFTVRKESTGASGRDAAPTKLKEDPQASKLLADARAARANWEDFPGFTADVEVNFDGKTEKGSVKVSSSGKVELTMEGEHKDWTRTTLSSIVGHRLSDGTTLNTPCAFADDVKDHPLGRAIRVLNDEYHSSYRIRDRQVIEVNRAMGDMRFTITVLENRQNAEKQFLPSTYVVNTWDLKSDALRSSVSFFHTWQRVGKYDLPVTTLSITATAGKQQAKTLKLANVKLLTK